MITIQEIIENVSKQLNVRITCQPLENGTKKITKQENATFFTFHFQDKTYLGKLNGESKETQALAKVLPTYIEQYTSIASIKNTPLRSILSGTAQEEDMQRYVEQFSFRGVSCFVLVIQLPKRFEDAKTLLQQYVDHRLDEIIDLPNQTLALVKFIEKKETEYSSGVDYANFLALLFKEELGLDAQIGVGSTVREWKGIALSFNQAEETLRLSKQLTLKNGVYSYREFILTKILNRIPREEVEQYVSETMDEKFKDILDDEETLSTAEGFLEQSLNISETARNLYMHRNTVLYRLDKIQRITGLNLRQFPDAVAFKVLLALYRRFNK